MPPGARHGAPHVVDHHGGHHGGRHGAPHVGRLRADAPSLGVRLWVEHEQVCIQLANEGGHGAPRWMALLPVVGDAGSAAPTRVHLAIDLAGITPDGVAGFRETHLRRPPHTLPTPFTKRYSGDEWRRIVAPSSLVLALMLSRPSDLRPTGTGAPTETTEASGMGPPNDWPAIRAALSDFFVAPQDAPTLRRGLIHLCPDDVPARAPPPGSRARTARAAGRAGAQAPAPAPAAAQAQAQAQAAPHVDPHAAAQADPHAAAPAAAHTATPAEAPVTFVLASCQYPAGLADATPQHAGATWAPAVAPAAGHAPPPRPDGPADASMLRLAGRLWPLDRPDRPSLLLLAGDQIYADATAGLFDPRTASRPADTAQIRDAEDWLRIPYQHWYSSVGAQSVFGLLPIRTMLDDHEIDENWQPLLAHARREADAQNRRLRAQGIWGYGVYQRNRPGLRTLGCLWQRFEHRGLRIFLADTRTERQPRRASLDPLEPPRRVQRPDGWRLEGGAPKIMSSRQELALLSWLCRERERPAFVVSPSIFLPRRRVALRGGRSVLLSDAWDGYPRSLHTLLALLWRTGRSNAVFLSGDEHVLCIVEATVSDVPCTRRIRLHSIHSSALYAPYPFANSVPEDLAVPDDWTFDDPTGEAGVRLRCVVTLRAWAPGDGFACLTLAGGRAPTLTVAFDRAGRAAEPISLALALE